MSFATLIDELITLVGAEADRIGCAAEVRHARRIVTEGTSADRQVQTLAAALAAGATREDAKRAVVDMLIAETVAGC